MLALATLVLAAAPSCAMMVHGARQETDPHLIALFNDVVRRSGITAGVTLCAAPGMAQGHRAGTARVPDAKPPHYNMYLGWSFRKRLDDLELRGVIAHELAHIVRDDLSPPPFWHMEAWEDYLAREATVDALAATWVGPEALIAAMRKDCDIASSDGTSTTGMILELTYRELKLEGW